MGTRCGDVDAGVIAFLERTEGLSAAKTEEFLNKSGLMGLSGASSDMREVLKAAAEEQPRSLLALKAYCYRVRKYIGAYVAAMGGLDTVVFTGGIGQGSAEVRALATQGLERHEPQVQDRRRQDQLGKLRIGDREVQAARHHLRETAGESRFFPHVHDDRDEEQADDPLQERHSAPVHRDVDRHADRKRRQEREAIPQKQLLH